MTYRAVLFDLDGTLLDSLADLAAAMNTVLTAHGFAAHPVDAYRYYVGDGIETMVRRALPPGQHQEQTLDDCVQALRTEYGRCWHTETKPYPGVTDLLTALAEHHIPMAILSNKPDDFTRKMVTTLLPSWQFAHVFGVRPGIPKKPNPQAAIAIAEQMGISATDFLYLGDTNTDMLTANGAGMHAVGVTWGFRTRKELEESGARTIIDSPPELVPLLSLSS